MMKLPQKTCVKNVKTSHRSQKEKKRFNYLILHTSYSFECLKNNFIFS